MSRLKAREGREVFVKTFGRDVPQDLFDAGVDDLSVGGSREREQRKGGDKESSHERRVEVQKFIEGMSGPSCQDARPGQAPSTSCSCRSR